MSRPSWLIALRKFAARTALPAILSISSGQIFLSKTGKAMVLFCLMCTLSSICDILGPHGSITRISLAHGNSGRDQHLPKQAPKEIFPRVAFNSGGLNPIHHKHKGWREMQAAVELQLGWQRIMHIQTLERRGAAFGCFWINRANLFIPAGTPHAALFFRHNQACL